MQTEELVRSGKLMEALTSLEGEVRTDPASAKLRVFLFQLLCVLGDWPRAMTQLNVAAELDAKNLLLAAMYRPALNCEALRSEIFSGNRSPLIFGEPQEWLGWLIQANQMAAQEKPGPARELRDSAFEAAEAIGGQIDGKGFEWICDGDSRLGPVLETIIDGKYYWMPFALIKSIAIEAPVDLRDMVWIGANFTWVNGGESFGLIPTRYPETHTCDDSGLRLARKTEWVERGEDYYFGLGQRVLATDADEYALLEVRRIVMNHADETGDAGD